MADGIRTCHACGQAVQLEAQFCRSCGANLSATAVQPLPGQTPTALPPPPPKRGMSTGMLLLIIGCAVGLPLLGVGAIVAAIALPGFSAAKLRANERMAAASLRTIATAEADFRANDRDNNMTNDFWVRDVATLYYHAGGGFPMQLIEQAVADADASRANAVPRAGYLFAAIPLDDQGRPFDGGAGYHYSRYAFCAYPAQYGKTGRLTFIVNEDGTVWSRDTGGRPVTQWPGEPRWDGWSQDF